MATKKLSKSFTAPIINVNKNPWDYLDELDKDIKDVHARLLADPNNVQLSELLTELCARFQVVQDLIIKSFKKNFESGNIVSSVLSDESALSKLQPSLLQFDDGSKVAFSTSEILEVNKDEIIALGLSNPDGSSVDNQTAYCRYQVKESEVVKDLHVTDANDKVIDNLDDLCKHLLDASGLPSYFVPELMYKFKPNMAHKGDAFVKTSTEFNKHFE